MMHADIHAPFHPGPLLKGASIFALIFGAMTVFSSGNVLFGPQIARDMAGSIVPIVVWFNFVAGFIYMAAAIAIWAGWKSALGLSFLIAVSTAGVALIFGSTVAFGGDFELRTVIALLFRVAFWAAISFALYRSKQ